MNGKDREQFATDEAIEAALRGLPEIEVPRELEAKLVAGIPAPKVEMQVRPRRSRLAEGLAVAAAIAAVVLVMVGIAWQSAQNKSVNPAPPGNSNTMVAASFVQTKETDPCNILPTLPDWR
jgi:hypothetical protein